MILMGPLECCVHAPEQIWQDVDRSLDKVVNGSGTVDSGLYVAQLEVQLLEGSASTRIERLAEVELQPKVLDGKGESAGSREQAANDAHFPVCAALDLLRAHIHHRVHLQLGPV